MSTPNRSEADGKPVLTNKQVLLLVTVMQNVQGTPEIDWENVTSQLGYNNVRVAKEIYRQLKKKLDGATGALVITPGAGDPKTPSKVGKRTGRVGTKTPGSAKSNKANKSKEAQPEEEQGSSIPGEKQGDDAVAEDPFVV